MREQSAVFTAPDSTYSFGHEDVERAYIYEEAVGHDIADHAFAHFALERPPYHGLETDGELGESAAGKHARFRDVKDADHANNVEVSRVCSLDVLI